MFLYTPRALHALITPPRGHELLRRRANYSAAILFKKCTVRSRSASSSKGLPSCCRATGRRRQARSTAVSKSRSAACRKDCTYAKSATTAVVESDMPPRLHPCMQVLSADSGCSWKEKTSYTCIYAQRIVSRFFSSTVIVRRGNMFGNSVLVEAGIEIVRYRA